MDGEDLLTVDVSGQGDDGGSDDISAISDSTGIIEAEQHEDVKEDKQNEEPIVQDDKEEQREERHEEPKEEPELKDFRGTVSARIRGFIKKAPELGPVFQKYPELQSVIESVFRRENAMREIFPTIAEARAMREQFPSGQADVQALLEDVKEMEELDKSFDERGQDGTYPGHSKLIDNFFTRDKTAAISLLKTVPKEWARLDRDSYNEVMGKVIGATLASRGIPEFLSELADAAKEAEQPALESGLRKLFNWAASYTSEKAKPTAEEERLSNDRKAFERTRSETSKAESQRFHASFSSSNLKLQRNVIESHKAVQRLMKITSLSDDRKKEIVEKIRKSGESFLGKSPSFMRKLRPLYEQRNLEESANLQKAAWSQPWFLNMIVRKVFNTEIPTLVQNNREAAQRRSGTQQRSAQPASKKSGAEKETPKGPHQVGGQWYHSDGRRMTSAEVLSGKHLLQT